MPNVFQDVRVGKQFESTQTTDARFKELQSQNMFQGIPERSRFEATDQAYSNAKRVLENPRRVQVSPELDIELITLVLPDESS